MKIDIGAIIKAVQQAITAVAKWAWHQFLDSLNAPITMLASAAGITGEPRFPEQPPVFQTPGDINELVDEMANGHQRPAASRDLDRDGVKAVFELANLSKDERATCDLSAVERKDVRALLIGMTTSELQALKDAGPGAVKLLITDGDSKVWGVPTVASVPTANVMPHMETELSARLRRVKEAMAEPKRSLPFPIPRI